MADYSEKRRSKRIKSDSIVEFKGENFQIFSNINNIGEGGLFVNTYYMLDEGEPVNISLELPQTKKVIDARGIVVRKNPDGVEDSPGLGIEFESLSEEDREAISKLLD